MLKNKDEIRMFITLLFGCSRIKINGVKASTQDLVRLCEEVSCGNEIVESQEIYTNKGNIEEIYVTTI